ncbi:MAG TPA: type II toxin-antitoxin system VapC family toxin [Rhizomicrobium sp.]|nr:type II toxin-antitoxin system VapC family toxin [Rhizomicrobium sp.]
MSAYFDTSFLMPLVRREATSERVTDFLGGLAGTPLSTSHWTRVELCSAIARHVRMKVLRPAEAHTAMGNFQNGILQSFSLSAVTLHDWATAVSYLQNFETGLRAGDALHLAIGRNNNAQAIYSLDDRMIRAGKLLGLPVSRGIRGK